MAKKTQWIRDAKGDKTAYVYAGADPVLAKRKTLAGQILDAFYRGAQESFDQLLDGGDANGLWHQLNRRGKNLSREEGLKQIEAFLAKGK